MCFLVENQFFRCKNYKKKDYTYYDQQHNECYYNYVHRYVSRQRRFPGQSDNYSSQDSDNNGEKAKWTGDSLYDAVGIFSNVLHVYGL